MKIIFDSEEQKNNFLQKIANDLACPMNFRIDGKCNQMVDGKYVLDNIGECKECWENAIECEVKQ